MHPMTERHCEKSGERRGSCILQLITSFVTFLKHGRSQLVIGHFHHFHRHGAGSTSRHTAHHWRCVLHSQCDSCSHVNLSILLSIVESWCARADLLVRLSGSARLQLSSVNFSQCLMQNQGGANTWFICC